MAQLDRANGNVDTVISASIEIEGELSEAEGYLRAMDVEFRTMAASEKKGVQSKVSGYKEEFRQLQQSFQNTKFNAESEALKSGGSTARNRIAASNQKLDDATASLEQSRQLVAQTENIGNAVITDLKSQKETLETAAERVDETKGFTVEAKRILAMMGRRAILHKILITLTVIVLAAAIGCVAWFGIIQKGSK